MKTVTPISAPQMGELASQLHRAGYGSEDIDRLRANMPRFTGLLDDLAGRNNPLLTDTWLDALVAAEQTALRAFLGVEVNLHDFQKTLAHYGQERLQAWKELGLEPHFLPSVTLTRSSDLPGWKVKPNDWYWEELEAGNLLRPGGSFYEYRDATGELKSVRQAKFAGTTLLVDTRLKPRYKDGKQMWPSDKPYLGGILAKLRKEGKIQSYQYGPPSSRFGVSANEWEEHVLPALAELLGLQPHQLRLETALEANIIPQLYGHMARSKDGTTNTWTWYEERFESAEGRLHGGYSGCGGLAFVYWRYATGRGDYLSFRPLGVLDT